MIQPLYCTICSVPEESTLIVHINGKCPKEKKVHGFHFCPNCGYKLSESLDNSQEKENLNDMNMR